MFNNFGIIVARVSKRTVSFRTKKSFALSEAVVAVVVVSMLAVAMIDLVNSYYVFTSVGLTDDRMNKIEGALVRYVKTAGHLPCPSSLTVKSQAKDFGQSADCAAVTDGNGFMVLGSGSKKLVKGALPVKDLSLPQSYAYDKWGRRFGYAVVADLAASKESFLQYGPIANTDTVITIRDVSGERVSAQHSEQPAYVLLSYGKAGMGAYNASGAVGVACDKSYLESPNCSNSSVFIYSNTVQLGAPSSYFDDIVYWGTYGSLLGAYYQNNVYLDITTKPEIRVVVDGIINDAVFNNITKEPGVYLLTNCNAAGIAPHLASKPGDAGQNKHCVVVRRKDVPEDKLILVHNLAAGEVVMAKDEGLFRENNGRLDFALDLSVLHIARSIENATSVGGLPKERGLYIAANGSSITELGAANGDIIYTDSKGRQYRAATPREGSAVVIYGSIHTYINGKWVEQQWHK